jgi:hypothetical protein
MSKGGIEMNKKFITAVVSALFLVMGYAALAEAEGGAGATPVITQGFAAREAWPGQTWKIYLKASDPNGDMKNIYAVVEQPGVGQYPLSIIRVKEENKKEISGYIYLVTSTPHYPLNFVHLTVTVNIQDRSGNFSAPAVFGLSLNPRSAQEAPPQGVFKEQELGPIMIRLQTIDGASSGGNSAFAGL